MGVDGAGPDSGLARGDLEGCLDACGGAESTVVVDCAGTAVFGTNIDSALEKRPPAGFDTGGGGGGASLPK